MHRRQNPNLQILELAIEYLGPLADNMVFVGGCATGLLLTDIGAPPIRATQDVDAITELASLGDYHRLSGELRKRGFKEDQSPDAPVCRWVAAGVVLDIMPTSLEVLGFGNRWYQSALDSAASVELPSGRSIRMVTAPYFLTTKLDAFVGRGMGDYLMSHDMEDIVAVLDGRSEIVNDIEHADAILREHLRESFNRLLGDAKFVEALPGHLPGDAANQARVPLLMERIQAIAGRSEPASELPGRSGA
jgi:predicted nucleotidyltransferase